MKPHSLKPGLKTESIRLLRHAAMFLIALFTAWPAYADIVHLKNGGSLEGTVVENGDNIIVQMPAGTVTVSKEQVERIEKSRTIIDDYNDKLKGVIKDDPTSWLALAAWCRQNNLPNRAEAAFKRVLELDPENETARKHLGYEKIDGVWYKGDDIFRAKGMVRYKERWVTPAEKEQLVQLDELNKKREKMEKELHELEKKRIEEQRKLAEAQRAREEAEARLLNAQAKLAETESERRRALNNPVYLRIVPPTLNINQTGGSTPDAGGQTPDSNTPRIPVKK